MVTRPGAPMWSTQPPLAHRVLRIISIGIIIVGVVYLGVAYCTRYARRPRTRPGQGTGSGRGRFVADNTTRELDNTTVQVDNTIGETEYTIDLRTFRLPERPDNVAATPTVSDNVTDVEAVVGLEAVRDGAWIEPQPLFYLLREVEHRRPADDLFMKRVPVVRLAELRADPGKFRGRPVRVRGRIIRVERSTLPENPSDIREVIEGDLLAGQEGICMFVASRVVAVHTGQDVEIRGLFMALVAYAGRGGRHEDAPLIVTSHPVPLRTTQPVRRESFSPDLLIGVLVVLFVIYFVMMFVLRSRSRSRNRQLEARRKARTLTFRTRPAGEVTEPEETEETEGTEEG